MAESGRAITPSSVTEVPWLYERRMGDAFSRDYPPEESGKWMMFYSENRIDDAWSRAVTLFRSGQLPDITSMKVSTAMPTGQGQAGCNVLIFYCGPASDEDKMLAIGRDVADKMAYGARTISYKPDDMTARGQRGSLYTIKLS